MPKPPSPTRPVISNSPRRVPRGKVLPPPSPLPTGADATPSRARIGTMVGSSSGKDSRVATLDLAPIRRGGPRRAQRTAVAAVLAKRGGAPGSGRPFSPLQAHHRAMKTEMVRFPGADGQKLAARLDSPDEPARAYALFAH